ncbi:small ribosomal subunit protein bTHXc-like [Cornus florida]|uniref:small ribosomal subunit protein bTHXc-like n=1 Tax=Cornus florida TaxID=4283 RepID=UPI0028972E93|nr:small ribosomal subunit protein bTHXc-like [Cornus florida]
MGTLKNEFKPSDYEKVDNNLVNIFLFSKQTYHFFLFLSILLSKHTPKLSPSPSFSHSQSSVGISLPTSSISFSTSASLPQIYCGRGDKKAAKGKRFNHSFGNARSRNKNKGRGPPRVSVPPAPPKKDSFDDDEVKIDIDESLF